MSLRVAIALSLTAGQPGTPWQPEELDGPPVVVEGSSPNRRIHRGVDDVEGDADVLPEARPAPDVPPPRVQRYEELVRVAVGLSPDAPGSKAERQLESTLEATVRASSDPPTQIRYLRPGVGSGRQVCRDRRDDLVVLIGYVPEREDPVVLTHDCRLDRQLGVRSAAAASQPGLVGALWKEHRDLVRSGLKERRTTKLSRGVRIGIAAGVALAVIGVAVGVLVAGSLRDETVVLTVQ